MLKTIYHGSPIILPHPYLGGGVPYNDFGAGFYCTEHMLIANDSIPVMDYDLMIGYRADDSYFSFARAFLSNQISLGQLAHAMQLGHLGEQIVIKSETAYEHLQYLGFERADHQIYYPLRKRRDEEARSAYQRLLEAEEPQGIFIRDLMHEAEKGI